MITPIGELKDVDGQYRVGSGAAGEVTLGLRQALLDIQYGRREDTHGWTRRIR